MLTKVLNIYKTIFQLYNISILFLYFLMILLPIVGTSILPPLFSSPVVTPLCILQLEPIITSELIITNWGRLAFPKVTKQTSNFTLLTIIAKKI